LAVFGIRVNYSLQFKGERRTRTKFHKEFTPGQGYTKEDWDEVSDNPELTDEELAQGKPFAEMFLGVTLVNPSDAASRPIDSAVIGRRLTSPEAVAAYLQAVFEAGDPALVAAALGDTAGTDSPNRRVRGRAGRSRIRISITKRSPTLGDAH
jgi:hypothetical protein